jgi:hypothetical protein
MHPSQKLGNANTVANYHEYYYPYQKWHCQWSCCASNAYLTTFNVPVTTKCIIMKYRTGTLYNQKHAIYGLSARLA